ncbi:MAG: hypothetical protein A2639_00435 [Candidatus Staskawiczbacteria bacterium RIFCSPHIGHO2_01_FULL_34_27]|uniref:Uncharacterized protein n=1 Tax=Candidatus Staskawiczbacteria bacterium RIFCSPHIGHO2_01_FULL_34_27 TaxID=1802199 RepID=A0A1G2HJ91_9BACT|nr:hypothetical protein [Candidatus Pacearchaeota archaeon]OGZ62537.1 MAG: hypothetical protein A2639_00435 [Candidatus Staskawiczbacteria bacterium RIFCSPHIGHO2_01_FULL_34_27]
MNWKKHLREVLLTLLIAFAIISFWRGVWGLMDVYLFPGNHFISYVASIIIGVAILYFNENLLKKLI